MSDIMQDPIMPGQQPQPQPQMPPEMMAQSQPQPQLIQPPVAPQQQPQMTPQYPSAPAPLPQQKNNSALKVVVIVICVLFGLPMLIVLAIIFFVGMNADKLDDLVYDQEYKLSDEWKESVENVYKVATDPSARSAGISRTDCNNIGAIIDKYASEAMTVFSSYCDSDTAKIGTEETKEDVTLYFESYSLFYGDSCVTLTFLPSLKYIKAFTAHSNKACSTTMYNVDITDGKLRASTEDKNSATRQVNFVGSVF